MDDSARANGSVDVWARRDRMERAAMTGSDEVRLGTRPTLRVWLVRAMGLFAAAYAAILILHGASMSQDVTNGVGLLAVWMSAGVCALAVSRVRFRRWEVLLAAASVTSFAAGDSYYTWLLKQRGSVPFPSLADLGFLLVYPFMMAALVVAVHRHSRRLASSVWLDCAVGSLGAASVLAVVLSPVLDSALTDSLSWATAVAVAYPMFDLLLVAAVAGIAALRGVRMGRRWGLLLAGLMAFAGADLIYALQVTADTYLVRKRVVSGQAKHPGGAQRSRDGL